MAERTRTHVRGDIQGLRAVAVLMVFANHLFGWPAGGFVGVDVFFVISGFLITGLLVREYERSGHISFTGFYSRRARRILPAAIVTLAITVGLSFVLFPASKAVGILWDGIASFFFVGNWRFAATGTDYFAAGTPSPLQHFWSLSLEEQFYFVWPWLMLGILIIGTRLVKRSVEGAIRATGIVMLVIVGVSFALAVMQSASEPTIAYFSTLTRVWELGVGAALAIFAPVFSRLPSPARDMMSWGGLAVIAGGMFVISPESTFPAPWGLIPVLGSALVLAAGIGTEPASSVLLNNPASRYIGDISYSLYLWHFPVIILGTAMFPAQGIWYFIGASAVGIVLAVLSFELIERPLLASPWLRPQIPGRTRRESWAQWRRDQASRVRMVTATVLMPATVALIVLGMLFPPGALSPEQVALINKINAEQDSQRGDEPEEAANTSEIAQGVARSLTAVSWPEPLTPSIGSVAEQGRPEEEDFDCSNSDSTRCVFGDPSDPSILVYGDSLATTLLPTVRSAYEQDHRIRGLTRFACAVTDVSVEFASAKDEDACLAHRQNVRSLVAAMKPSTVIVIQNYLWANKLSSGATGKSLEDEWRAGVTSLEKDLLAAGASEVLFVTPPPEGKSIVDCATAGSAPSACVSDIPGVWEQIRRVEASMSIKLLDETDMFCVENKCPVINGSTIIRRDNVHPTRQYAKQIAAEWRARAEALIGASAR
ncbi:acyltransferase family protein [Microbacterium sp. 69-10]|uniref:acyltransferase family protein n=1 Tax=Microbacterium sp. 69-10 TaxID=1895783 RepID=UPI0025EDCCFE|nr:acyltransferase family protein [Microbacterium sp. 69-10]